MVDGCDHSERWLSVLDNGARRFCGGCNRRVIECDQCSAKIAAASDIADSGWMKGGNDIGAEWTLCPSCYAMDAYL